MTSQENVGGDVLKPIGEAHTTQPTGDPKTGNPNIGKIILYVIIALVLIGACSAMSKEGGGDVDDGSKEGGFFSTIFGEPEEDADAPSGEIVPPEPEDDIPDGKG